MNPALLEDAQEWPRGTMVVCSYYKLLITYRVRFKVIKSYNLGQWQ